MSQWEPIEKLAANVNSGETSAESLVDLALKTIEQKKDYKAIITTLDQPARIRAKMVDQLVSEGKNAGRLAGVPFIAKDNFLVYGADTTAASNILKGFKAPYQSSAINRLEAEGAVCVAKANLDAFAHGASTENSDFFTTLNPHDKTRVPGGSSGGSAAAVVLDMAPFAIGTDTGGSIRQPSSLSGCVGYKPTYGLVSRSGVVAMASSTDVIGPLTRTVDDSALILDVMAGKDELDSTTVEREASYDKLNPISLSGLKVGVIKEQMGEGLDPGVKQVIEEAVTKLKAAGAEIKEISLPSIDYALAVYYIICPAEVSSNLMRYDGQRFGYSYADARDVEQSYTMSRGHGFGKEAKRRIMIGTYVLSSGYYDAYYKKAQIVRTKLIKEFDNAFSQVDFLLGPVSPTPAFKIGARSKDPLEMYLADILSVAPNLVGVPAISLPAGNSDNLPVGLHLIGQQRHDRALLEFAKATEEALL